jgi:glycosyltransferase involved in cell wall biosynthesis
MEVMSDNVLWIAPNLNHYKARFLNRLAERGRVRLTVLAGRELRDMGHRRLRQTCAFRCVDVPVAKEWFAFSPAVYWSILTTIRRTRPAVVLMPAEKKHIPLIVMLSMLRRVGGYRLVSYNHPVMRSDHARVRRRDLLATRAIYLLYDLIVFYTAESREYAVMRRLLPAHKTAYANNTLDTATIWEHYTPQPASTSPPCMLFIGRLVKLKRLDDLLRYYAQLKRHIPQLRLRVIGDGPEADLIRSASDQDKDILWTGATTDERVIASAMQDACVVFVPGWSGLSIVHAFAYGKPYVTIKSSCHPPEIDYLVPGHNGLLLSGDCEADCRELMSLLQDEGRYRAMCQAAFETARRLSIENWLSQMEGAITSMLPTMPAFIESS